jgi:hypothetical protein
MLRLIFILFGIYIVYQLIFKFILPVYRVSSQVRQQFSQAQEQMRQQQHQQQQPQRPAEEKPVSKGDYIDFEEVR